MGAAWHNSDIEVWILELEKELAYCEKVVYQGHTIRRQEKGWLLVLRAKKAGRPVVAFIGGRDVATCFELARTFTLHGGLKWLPDRFA